MTGVISVKQHDLDDAARHGAAPRGAGPTSTHGGDADEDPGRARPSRLGVRDHRQAGAHAGVEAEYRRRRQPRRPPASGDSHSSGGPGIAVLRDESRVIDAHDDDLSGTSGRERTRFIP